MATLGERLPAPENGWRRYDHLYSSITYTGTWKTETLASNYGGSATYTQTSGATVNFSFQGTMLRIIGARLAGRTTTTQVIVDGTLRGIINETYTSGGLTQALVFDISGLTEGIHTVQIKTVDTALFIFDAIDIDSKGYLLWGVSTSPETGWARYDIVKDMPNVAFTGVWNTNYTFAGWWGSTLTSSSTFGKIGFWFYGTKLRIYDSPNTNRSTKNMISIDGLNKEYSAYRTSVLDQVIVFEITDLSLGYHYAEISIPSTEIGKILAIDAIEIDSTGEFRNPYSKMLLSSGNMYYSKVNHINNESSVPRMTSNITPSGIVSASSVYSSIYEPWRVFSGGNVSNTDCWTTNNIRTGWLMYKFDKDKQIVRYSITSRNDNSYRGDLKRWTFEGSTDGVVWDVLDYRVNEREWSPNESRNYTISDYEKSYSYFRINVSETYAVGNAAYITIGMLSFYEYLPGVMLKLTDYSEANFLKYGIDLNLNNFSEVIQQYISLKNSNSLLGAGRIYEHVIDMAKRRVDKITLE
ncbi:hypothetical protein M3629_02010 [Paenibacillus polysaccharolyticus]|uniref:hypothetical protein n=1 Tax=Paenibacillus polysaccharolyticus TaxID=582692 RepID=UPI00203B6887|nr:hypothetical protein [Paenibacillus polysaccharolyticus]MCM3131540.1 hypothetical protein [Paenibacillus polysaccharolyticus]